MDMVEKLLKIHSMHVSVHGTDCNELIPCWLVCNKTYEILAEFHIGHDEDGKFYSYYKAVLNTLKQLGFDTNYVEIDAEEIPVRKLRNKKNI